MILKEATAQITVNHRNWGSQSNPGSDILVLGGTSLALKLTRKLIEQGYSVIYSIAGLVRKPDLPFQIISGGFTPLGGMAAFIHAQKISLVIDATHPYAAQISQHAATAAKTCGIPCWRLQRPGWQAVAGDCWSEFVDWDALLPALAAYKHVFLTQGRLSAQQLEQLTAHRQPEQQFYLRTAVQSVLKLPDWIEPIQAIGPFHLDEELALLRRLQIDVLVSKNSGGEMTLAKLVAARELRVPVLFLQRPGLAKCDCEYIRIDDILTALKKNCTLAP